MQSAALRIGADDRDMRTLRTHDREYQKAGEGRALAVKTLFEATVPVVDRAADCFAREDWGIDPDFWETLYGPCGDGPDDRGMRDFCPIDRYDDC